VINQDQRSPQVEKTNPIVAVTALIKAIAPLIWLVVILVIVLKIWGSFSLESVGNNTRATRPETAQVIIPKAFAKDLDESVKVALQKARQEAELAASQKLDEWMEELMTRVDNDFLPWYFNYFNQLYLGAKGIALDVSGLITQKLNFGHDNWQIKKAEILTEEFQRQFTKRVFKPEIAQLKLERFTRETVNVYIEQLTEQLAGIQSEYKIPQPQWERYLQGISTTIKDSGGSEENLSSRVLSRGGGYLIALPLTKTTIKLGTGLATKFAEKAAVKTTGKMITKISTKTAAKVASEFSAIGLQLIDPLAALGILAWDIWDHYQTVAVEKPKMREAIVEYLQEIKQALLYNNDNSIMSAVYGFEAKITD